MSAKHETRREMGWLVYGIVLGAILSICVNIWTHIYLKWFETTYGISDWMPSLLFTTILLVFGLGFLTWYALRILLAKPSQENSQVGFFNVMNLSDLDREELRHIAQRNLTLAGFTLTALSVIVGFYRENLTDAFALISLLLSSMLLFFLASQMAYEAERLWHGFSADILHYVGVIILMGAFTYFINVKIQSWVLTYLSMIFIIIIALYALKGIYNLYSFYRDYGKVKKGDQSEQKKRED